MKLLVAVLLMTAACATPVRTPEPAPARLVLTPCGPAERQRAAMCGQHEVFEDREARAGRRIALHVVVLPAESAPPAPDPVFFLAGGPAQGATDFPHNADAGPLAALRRERDLVFVDQRGTGKSHRLPCQLRHERGTVQDYFTDLFPPELVRACRQELERVADLTKYTTPIAMADLDEVRASLGYERINIYGLSYGTLAAREYLRQHPTRVRTLTLAGVSTPEVRLPLQFAKGTQTAIDALVRDCAADDRCRGAVPDLAGDLATILRVFEQGPVQFELPHPRHKIRQPVILSRGVFVERLRLMLYDLGNASRVPLLLHHAARGHWVPFGEAALGWGGTPFGIAFGTYLTITCSEGAATISENDIAQETAQTLLGDYRTRRHIHACQEWPRGDIPRRYYAPVRSDVPVLMLSGEIDPATPPHFGTAAARSLPNSRQLIAKNTAHGFFNECFRALVSDFVARGSANDLNTQCLDHLRRPPFVTELPGGSR